MADLFAARCARAGADEQSSRRHAAGRYSGRSSLALPVGLGIRLPAIGGSNGENGWRNSRTVLPHPVDIAAAQPASTRLIGRACSKCRPACRVLPVRDPLAQIDPRLDTDRKAASAYREFD